MQRKMKTRERFHIPDSPAAVFSSAETIAKRWGCSVDKVSRMLEQHRGEPGFMDIGARENVRTHKRRYAIYRIHPTLLTKIEASLKAHRS
jgi:hypothetical protein